MSVRRRKWRDPKTGAIRESWIVDVDIQLPDGQRKRLRRASPVQSRRGAQAFERRLREQLLAGTYGKKEVNDPTLSVFSKEFLDNYARSNNKPSEYTSKKSILSCHLIPALGHLKLSDINERVVEQFKATQCGKELSHKTVNNHLTVLKTLLKKAKAWGMLEDVPGIQMLKSALPEIDFLSTEEIRLLVEAAWLDPYWWSQIVVALNTGMRSGELRALRWERCDLANGQITVALAEWQGELDKPKSGKERIVPLNDLVLEALQAHRDMSQSDEWVWAGSSGGHQSKWQQYNGLQKIRKKAGLRKFSWHVLRHSFASQMVMSGAPLKVVQELLGHSTMAMTMRYAHLSPGFRKSAVNRLAQAYGTIAAHEEEEPDASEEGPAKLAEANENRTHRSGY